MAYAMLIAATKVSNETAKMVIRHAITDDPKRPFASGYNRPIMITVRAAQSSLKGVY